jgi:hypothetical protein
LNPERSNGDQAGRHPVIAGNEKAPHLLLKKIRPTVLAAVICGFSAKYRRGGTGSRAL